MACTADNAENAARQLQQQIRTRVTEPVVFEMPYIGQQFSMHWEDIKKPKPPEEDEFEHKQKITRILQKDIAR